MPEGSVGLNIELGALDSSEIDLDRPRLFITPAEVDAARERIRSDTDARRLLDELIAEAEKAMRLEPAPLAESWWDAASTRPWEETYPDIYKHTALEPAPTAKAASTLANAWLLTGEDRFAERAADLLQLLAPYRFRAEHFDVGMNYTGWGMLALSAADMLGPKLSTPERRSLDAFFTRLGKAVLANDVFWIKNDIGGGINNHLAWHKTMLGLLGLYYGRKDLVAFCLDGPRGLLPLLADGLLDDGLWCESSLVYHFTAIIPMVWFGDAQRRIGAAPTLYEVTAANGRTLRQAFDAIFHVLAPCGMIPPIGDAYGMRVRLFDNPLYESAWRAYRDPKYAWLLSRAKKRPLAALFSPPLPKDPAPPPIATALRPEHGYAFLRSHENEAYWGDTARMAFLTYDRSNVHANADRLSLMLFGQGRMLLSDVEAKATVPHAFSSRVQRELNRGGLSQNTVMIDGADQRTGPRLLRLVEFHDTPDEKRVSAVDEEGLLYEGVRQMRTICMTPDYVLDVFQVDCGASERRIDWIAHVMDETATLQESGHPLQTRLQPETLPSTGAYAWLRNPRSAAIDGQAELDFRAPDARLRLILQGSASRLVVCGYPSTDESECPTIPMLIATARGKRALFIALWLIGDAPAAARIQPAEARGGRLSWIVTCDGHARRHFIPALA